jgi:hemolysin activation/secretion protein
MTMRALAALACLAVVSSSFAQSAAPAPGNILNDLERSLPSQPITSPEGVQIEIPDAPELSSATADTLITVRGYRISGNTAFETEALLALIAERTGEMSLAQLSAIADELTTHYRSHGYPLARAYLPQQEIEEGIVTLAVLEGRYDQIAANNTARVSDRRVARTLQNSMCVAGENCKGALIARRPLERGLMLLNDTPGAQAAARLSPGEAVGTSTLTVDASADPLVSGSLQLDNGGSYYSGVARALGALWVDSPFGYGDQITAQAGASTVHGQLYYAALGYGVPLGYSGTRLGVRGSYLEYELGDRYESLDAHGTVRSTDVSLFHPFIRSRTANLIGSLAYGERRFHDLMDAVDVSTKRRIRDRGEAGVSADLRDGLFAAPALNTLSVLYTTGRLQLDEQLAALDAAITRSAGRYAKWGAVYSRLQSITGRTSLYLRAAAQITSDNLDSYEKFALGGPDSVRAYPPGETLADEAVLYSVELRQGFDLGAPRPLDAMLFYDRAHGRLSAKPWEPGVRNRETLSGVGVGISYAFTDRMLFTATLALRGDREMTAAPDHSYYYGMSLRAAL